MFSLPAGAASLPGPLASARYGGSNPLGRAHLLSRFCLLGRGGRWGVGGDRDVDEGLRRALGERGVGGDRDLDEGLCCSLIV